MLNNYKKNEKKKDEDIVADVAQREHSNIKFYALTFINNNIDQDIIAFTEQNCY